MILHSESWHSQKSLLKHFQGCLGIFKDINAYLATLTDVQLIVGTPLPPLLKMG